jgi:hypothetical protein
LEVAASLAKRDQMPLATSLLLYFTSYLKAEMASRDCPRCFVSYAQTLSDWRVLESKLRSILGPRLPMLNDVRSTEISEYLAPDLRHRHCDHAELARRNEIPGIVAELYDLLTEAEAGGDAASVARAFDDLLRSADGMTALFRDLAERESRAQGFREFHELRVTAPLRWLKHELQRK